MAVPARLTRLLHRTLGDEGGDDLANWMARVDANRSEIRDAMEVWTARGDTRFALIDARFDRVDARFAEVEARFDRVDARFAEVEARFDRVDARFAQVDARFAQVDARFAEFGQRFDRVDTQFAELRTAMVSLELRIERRISDLFKWSFVFWCGAMGTAILALVLR